MLAETPLSLYGVGLKLLSARASTGLDGENSYDDRADIVYAFVKKGDWLKPVAEELMFRIKGNKLGVVYTSREALHELY